MVRVSLLLKFNALAVAAVVLATFLAVAPLRAAIIWTEGEAAVKSDVKRHPWWYDKVDKSQLSGGDMISNWSDKPGNLEYSVLAPKAGEYDFWVRANPIGTKLSYQINGAAATEIDLEQRSARECEHRRGRQTRLAVPGLGPCGKGDAQARCEFRLLPDAQRQQ